MLVRVDPPGPPATLAAALDRYDQFRAAARALPGVEHASLSAMTPLGGTMTWQIRVELPGLPHISLSEDERTRTANIISPDFFATFGTRVVAGREFLPRTMPAPRRSRSSIRRSCEVPRRRTPMGRAVRHVGFVGRPSVDREIVGVVEDAAYLSLREMKRPTMYIPLAQRPVAPPVVFVGVRRAAQVADDRRSMRSPGSIRSAACPRSTLVDQVDGALAQERLVALLSGFFGVLALVLAGLGLYGVTAHSVGQRRASLASAWRSARRVTRWSPACSGGSRCSWPPAPSPAWR